MDHCPRCGFDGSTTGAAYCARCGTPLPRRQADPPTGPIALPGVDWGTAARAAGQALLALAGLPVLAAILLAVLPTASGAAAPGLGAYVGVVGAGMASAMGGVSGMSASLLGNEIGFSSSVLPLTVTFAAMVVLGAGNARSLPSGQVPPARALRQTLLTLGLFVAGLLLVTVVANAAYTSALSGLAGALVGASFGIGLGSTAIGAILLGGVALAVGLCWARPEVLPPGLRGIRDLLAGAATAARITVWLFAPAVLVGLVSAMAAGGGITSAGDLLILLALIVVFAPNLVLLVLGFASGVPISLDLPPALGPLLSTGGVPTSSGLLDAARATAWVWILPILAAVCLLLGAARGAFVAPNRHVALARGWLLAPVWALVLVAGGLLTAVRLGGELPIPGLVQMSLDVSVHLSYGLALLAGLVWGVLAGPLGALLARALPDDVALGFRGGVTRRRTAVTAAVVTVVCLLTASTAAASVSTMTPTPTPTPTPAPTTTYPTTQPYPTTTTTTVPPASTSPVSLDADAANHPDAAQVQSVLTAYFAAINAHDYDAWASAVSPALAADQPRAAWEQGYRTTQDDQIVVSNIRSSSSTYAQVSFRSTQDPADAPKDMPAGSICWSMTYPIDLTNAKVGQPVRGTVSKQQC